MTAPTMNDAFRETPIGVRRSVQLRFSGSAGLRQLLRAPSKQSFSRFPADTRICDRDAVAKIGGRFRKRLVAFFEVAFDHHANERARAGDALLNDVAPDILLPRHEDLNHGTFRLRRNARHDRANQQEQRYANQRNR